MQFNQNMFTTFGLSVFGMGIYMLLKKKEKKLVDHKCVVVISGSNSGLG